MVMGTMASGNITFLLLVGKAWTFWKQGTWMEIKLDMDERIWHIHFEIYIYI
jgi:hypothetical protein